MSYFCHSCKNEIKILTRIGRGESCPACHSDLHCCMNCVHYDPSVYNECLETQADRVLEKDRSNFCEYFAFAQGEKNKLIDEKELARKKLEELFRK